MWLPELFTRPDVPRAKGIGVPLELLGAGGRWQCGTAPGRDRFAGKTGGRGPGDIGTGFVDAPSGLLDEVAAVLAAYLEEAVHSHWQVINHLLDVWSVAHGIHPFANPKQLLTALVTRTWVTPAEITSTLDETRAVAWQATALSGALTSAPA